MNRFYKPTPREYVSTHVDMPWEFLQGAAETKQKGFDTAVATGDASEKLLNFKVAPGDIENYKKKVGQYNSEIQGATDYLFETGDYTNASRKLVGTVRNITADTDINEMKAFQANWEKALEERQKDPDYKTRSWWQQGEDLNTATSWNPELGRHVNRSIDTGYKSPDLNKDLRETFGTLHMSKSETGYDIVNDATGEIEHITTGGGSITPKYIEFRAKTILPNYLQTASGKDHIIQAQKEGYTGDALMKRASEIAYTNLYNHGLQQIQSESKNIRRKDYQPEWKRNEILGKVEAEKKYIPDSSFVVTKEQKPITTSDLLPLGANAKTNMFGSGDIMKIKFAPKTFSDLAPKYRATAEAAYKTLYGEVKYNEVKSGKKELTTADLNNFVSYYNNLNLGLRSNTNTASIPDVKLLHNDLFGFKEDAVPGGVIASGAGRNYPPNTKVYDVINSEWTTLGQIETANGDKAIKYTVNKEYGSHNPIYQISGKDPYFAQGYSIVGTQGNKTFQYILPTNTKNDEATMEAEVNNAIYSSGLPTHVNLYNQDYTILHQKGPNGKDAFSLVDVNPTNGLVKPHLINNQPAIFETPEALIGTVGAVIQMAQEAQEKQAKKTK
jgi:hypothetical protein